MVSISVKVQKGTLHAVRVVFGRVREAIKVDKDLRALGRDVRDILRDKTPRKLAKKWRLNYVKTPQGFRLDIENTRISEISAKRRIRLIDIIGYGQKAHWIEPKNAKALKFKLKRARKAIFSANVWHPGTKGTRLMRIATTAANRGIAKIEKKIKRQVRAATNK